jgi:hypothetical protein
MIWLCVQLTLGHIPSLIPALTARLGSPLREILLVRVMCNVAICKFYVYIYMLFNIRWFLLARITCFVIVFNSYLYNTFSWKCLYCTRIILCMMLRLPDCLPLLFFRWWIKTKSSFATMALLFDYLCLKTLLVTCKRHSNNFEINNFVVVFQCHHMSIMDFLVSLLVVAEV